MKYNRLDCFKFNSINQRNGRSKKVYVIVNQTCQSLKLQEMWFMSEDGDKDSRELVILLFILKSLP